jgi:hypothetical protein
MVRNNIERLSRHTGSATYLNAGTRTTLKALNCLTSPANDQTYLENAHKMLNLTF